MAIIFPDVEAIVVAYLSEALEARTEAFTDDVFVSTNKLQSNASEPDRQVIITGSYGRELDVIRKESTLTIDVFTKDYEEATNLSNMVAALINDCTGQYIKYVEVTLGPVRILEESTSEQRSISVDLVVKGENL
jgi:hypothetical protein